MKKIEIYDTTLRDGAQAETVTFTLEDKIRITERLDRFGVDYVEGGWPGSNPRDMAFFKEIKKYPLKHTRVAAFGSTHNPKGAPEKDSNLKSMVRAGTRVMTIVGKSWDVHVKDALRISLKRNLEIIEHSLSFLRPSAKQLFFDAEHFFDGYKKNQEYALKTLQAAVAGGADYLILCDTNGGTLPSEVARIVKEVRRKYPKIFLGMHAHNDAELGVANSLAAVEAGATQVQGTINGVGERCGNANLCSIIPALILKMERKCLIEGGLPQLHEVSRLVSELANIQPNSFQPYVGRSAFAHKGGIHISAVKRNPETYEHIPPAAVGNVQRILISDLSGKSTVIHKAQQYGLDINSKDPIVLQIVKELKELENQGFQFEGAEGSFELLMNRAMGTHKKYFELVSFRVITQKSKEEEPPHAEATIMVKVGGKVEHTAAEGNGPVNALDNAIRKALEKFYPELSRMSLEDYKVRVLPSLGRGTGAKVRVLIESGDRNEKWGTVGVSHDILEASWQALVDSVNYKLYKDEKRGK
ncbi:MAG: citramalate synthase [Deltaproteobacteria bacterium]|nr:citramalate synthase [Deltaproteobacteria bacterium]MBW2050946.1 citramalate synthase [Deltaproteobacteria bacterium]MBW2139617.1 citramalate synthase [Deltaproteobacteria bacterium]MBW2322271.1 citramalate synthase [Deltaproteobacteria bacterium]